MRILFFSAVLFLASCANETTTTEERSDTTIVTDNNDGETSTPPANDKPDNDETNGDDEEDNTSPSADFTGCYMQILQRDTLAVRLDQSGRTVTGRMIFDNYQKDGSSGSVKGVVEGNVVKLWYNFQSEGMNSIMQVWLKKEGDKLIRGTGDMTNKGDSSYFSNPSAVKYSSSQSYTKMNCTDVPAKYK